MQTDAIIAFAAENGRSRVAMRGYSMLPLLHEPYVLEIGAPRGKLKVGRIVLFRAGRRLVAHRIVKVAATTLWCSGDAHPAQTECIRREEVLGVVERVMADNTPNARRVDGLAFTWRGVLYARTRALRAWCVDALPQLRPRVYSALFRAVSAIIRDNREMLRAIIQSEEPWRVAIVAERHRCGPLLADALATLNDDDSASALRERLLRSYRSATLRTAKLREQLWDVLRVLREQNIRPVLLKGAARIWSRQSGFTLHDSTDLDLLLSADDMGRARDALVAAKYTDHVTTAAKVYYETVHHHAAPLFPPRSGVTVELHRALAPQNDITIPTSLEALEPFVERFQTPDGEASVLDKVGSALHLVVHGYQRPALRDIYLLAKLLQQMSEAERTALQDLLCQERKEPVRMRALIATAALCAGLHWPSDARTQRFLEWMLQR